MTEPIFEIPQQWTSSVFIPPPFFSPQLPLVDKIRTIAQKVYGAADIELSPDAKAKLDYYNQQVRSLRSTTRFCLCPRPSLPHGQRLTLSSFMCFHVSRATLLCPSAWPKLTCLCPTCLKRRGLPLDLSCQSEMSVPASAPASFTHLWERYVIFMEKRNNESSYFTFVFYCSNQQRQQRFQFNSALKNTLGFYFFPSYLPRRFVSWQRLSCLGPWRAAGVPPVTVGWAGKQQLPELSVSCCLQQTALWPGLFLGGRLWYFEVEVSNTVRAVKAWRNVRPVPQPLICCSPWCHWHVDTP